MVIGFLPKLFGPKTQRTIGLYAMAAILIFCGFMVSEGIVLTAATMGDKSAVTRMPVGLSYLSLPACPPQPSRWRSASDSRLSSSVCLRGSFR